MNKTRKGKRRTQKSVLFSTRKYKEREFNRLKRYRLNLELIEKKDYHKLTELDLRVLLGAKRTMRQHCQNFLMELKNAKARF